MKPEEIKIMGKGKGWVCVDKPGGISVHNDPGKDLVSILGNRLISKSEGRSGNILIQPVHRLDKETSGLLILATDRETLVRLSEAFAKGDVIKKYKALVHGKFDLPGKATGVWDAPLSKESGGRALPQGRGRRVKALTRYRILGQSEHYTLLEIELFTGRKHQIRRHAKLAGHPVVGDPRYSSPRAIRFLREKKGFYGMGLQSAFLAFEEKKKTVSLELEDLPRDIYRLFQEDGGRISQRQENT